MSSSCDCDGSSKKKSLYIPVADAVANADDYVFVDGSWWLPTMNRNAKEEFCQAHIPGARFFDIDDVSCKENNPKNLPHMMPTPDLFARAMDQMLNIRNSDKIIVYGQDGCPFLHRTWFTFYCMSQGRGCDDNDDASLQLLGGSLSDWKACGGSVESYDGTDDDSRIPKVADLDFSKPIQYQAQDPSPFIATMDQVRAVIDDDDNDAAKEDETVIADVRNADRFYGRVDEPRPNLRLGHMPGAQNLFFADLLVNGKPNSSILADDAILRERLGQVLGRADDQQQSVIATCGSGATACTLAAALYQLQSSSGSSNNNPTVRVYDGSWIEWGSDPDVPIVKDD